MKRALKWTAAVVLVGILAAGVLFWQRPVEVYQAAAEAGMVLEGASSRETTVEGMRVHYYVMGPEDGRPVVLVHGLGGRAEDWKNLAPYLTAAGFRVYIPDLPGYGQSAKPADFSYSVRDEAGVVVGFLDEMGLKQMNLGGWSMGGWIAQLVAAEHPERVKRLMLFDSAGLYARPTWDTAVFTPENAAQVNELNALLTPNAQSVPGFVARDIVRVSNRDGWVIQRAMAAMLTGKDTTDAILPRIAMPVLIVWGQKDEITPLQQGETMRRLIPQSELEVIPGCGHLAPRQCTMAIGPQVAAFLQH
ncbi:MAG TPA: alpha/beta hydrolase [Terracidiphilus sp.]|nr:alpha/beta hydrolase [Terracidiphilus sp.]